MSTTTVQLLAGLMAAINAATWVLASRWERPGRSIELRDSIRPPVLLGWGGDLAQVTPLAYPVLVVVVPRWGYEGWLNWSSGVDLVLQAVGLGAWALGLSVAIWAVRTLGRYVAVNGVAIDHELVTHGPYRYVRHPVYGSFTAIAVGTALIFRSYLLVAVAVVWVVASWWWVAAEEELLTSSERLGDAYRRYADRTGRFLPRLRRIQG